MLRARGLQRKRLEHIVQTPADIRLRNYSRYNRPNIRFYGLRAEFQLHWACYPRGLRSGLKVDENGEPVPDITDVEASLKCLWRFQEKPPTEQQRHLDASVPADVDGCLQCSRWPVSRYHCPADNCYFGRYCSAACRKDNWEDHKLICGKMEKGCSEADDDAPRGEKFFRAWLFPPDELEPRYVWLSIDYDTKLGRVIFKFDHKSILTWMAKQNGPLDSWISPCSSQHFSIKDGQMGHGNLLMGLYNTKGRGPEHVNRSINALAKPGRLHPVFGPVFVVAYHVDPRNGGLERFDDAGQRSFQYAVDCIRQTQNYSVLGEESLFRLSQKSMDWPGVKINRTEDAWNKALGITEPTETVFMNVDPLTHPGEDAFFVAKAFQMGLRWALTPVPYPTEADASWRRNWSSTDDDFPSLFADIATVSEKNDALWTEYVNFRPVVCWSSFVVSHCYGFKILDVHVKAAMAYVDKAEREGSMLTESGLDDFWYEYKASAAERGLYISHHRSPKEYEWAFMVDYDAENLDERAEGLMRFITPDPERMALSSAASRAAEDSDTQDSKILHTPSESEADASSDGSGSTLAAGEGWASTDVSWWG